LVGDETVRRGTDLLGNYWEAATVALFGGIQYKSKYEVNDVSLYPDIIDVQRKRIPEVKAAKFGGDLTISHRQLRARMHALARLPDWTAPYYIPRHGFPKIKSYRGTPTSIAAAIAKTPGYIVQLPPSLLATISATDHRALRHGEHERYPDCTVIRNDMLNRMVLEPEQSLDSLGIAQGRYETRVIRTGATIVDDARLPPIYLVRVTDQRERQWVRSLKDKIPALWFDAQRALHGQDVPSTAEERVAASEVVEALALPF
jgi:hypothetical protein